MHRCSCSSPYCNAAFSALSGGWAPSREMGLSWLRQRVLVLVLVLVMVTSSAIELNGDNVCHRVENYTVSLKESYTEPVIVNTVTWCLQIPPRCPRSRVEMRERWRIKTETRQRKIMECCEGYSVRTAEGKDDNLEDSRTGVCEPHCEICEYGRCVAPETCECEPGHRGDGCAYECPAGTWGLRCSRTCNCEPVEVCNTVDGKCHCPPGWRGAGCKEKCPADWWGLDCALPCACNNENGGNSSRSPLATRELSSVCHHETGICIASEETIVPFIGEIGNWPGGKERIESTTSVATTAFVPSPRPKSVAIDRIDSSTSISDYDSLDTDGDSEDDDPADPQGDRVATTLPRPTEREIDHAQPRASTTSTEGSLSETSPNPVVLETTTIGTSSIATITNKNVNYNGQEQQVERIDTKVPRVKKPSTPRPIVAVVHVSGNGSPGHDGPMIMTSLGAEKIPTHAVPMPLDVAALIVVGSIMSLGLTTLAVLAILHVRSRLFETIRLSIYDAAEKRDATTNGTIRRDGGEKGNNTGRISSLGCNSGIIACEYETPRCIVPEHQTLPRPRPASCAGATKKQESNYSNDYPNIRLFSNIQELLEAHYDRPPSTFRHAVVDVDGEHVYDEIPLQSSTTFTSKRDA